MQIAVLSDTHDNIWKLAEAMPHLAAADAVIHCGDLVAPFVLQQMGEGVPDKPIHVVWGNNDGDTFRLAKVAARFPHIVLHAELARIEIGGMPIAVTHYPEIARDLARSGSFRLVAYGHDHQAHEERVGDCLLLNPGEVMGMKGRSTLAVVGVPDGSVRWVDL